MVPENGERTARAATDSFRSGIIRSCKQDVSDSKLEQVQPGKAIDLTYHQHGKSPLPAAIHAGKGLLL